MTNEKEYILCNLTVLQAPHFKTMIMYLHIFQGIKGILANKTIRTIMQIFLIYIIFIYANWLVKIYIETTVNNNVTLQASTKS